MKQQHPAQNSGNAKPKLKNSGRAWTSTLKTWLALDKARGGNAAAVFRSELRRTKVGCFPEHLGLAPLAKSLRGCTEWWAGRGR